MKLLAIFSGGIVALGIAMGIYVLVSPSEQQVAQEDTQPTVAQAAPVTQKTVEEEHAEEIEEESVVEEQVEEVEAPVAQAPTPEPTRTVTAVAQEAPAPEPVHVEAAPVEQQVTQVEAAPQNHSCIITLFGSRYDVTQLRNTHSGGDIFVCGTDQSSLFQGAHAGELFRMEPYKIVDTISTDTTTTPDPVPAVVETAPVETVTAEPAPVETAPTTPSQGSVNEFTAATLAQHNTGSTCYIAHNGTVYDITGNASWANCRHHGARGGVDITASFPHPISYLNSANAVGTYVESTGGGSPSYSAPTTPNYSEEEEEMEEYEEADHEHGDDEDEDEEEEDEDDD